MKPLQERLREAATQVRVNAKPLSDLIPLMQEAADKIDDLKEEVRALQALYQWLAAISSKGTK